MANEPLQIWDLGVQASKDYALNQKELQKLPKHFLEDSKNIAHQAEVPVIKPAHKPEFEAKYDTHFVSRWAFFPKHPKFAAAANRLFTHRMIPSIARDFEKLLNKIDELKENRFADPTMQKEQKAILALLQAMVIDENTYEEILKGINRFHRA